MTALMAQTWPGPFGGGTEGATHRGGVRDVADEMPERGGDIGGAVAGLQATVRDGGAGVGGVHGLLDAAAQFRAIDRG
ncbi:hypothetical protein [Streptomyces goshikiensis]|uniref:hypothetical protein n=1 Tax=Streptomyces goshikiensis TaxID=1942 RepID=UPI0036D09A84